MSADQQNIYFFSIYFDNIKNWHNIISRMNFVSAWVGSARSSQNLTFLYWHRRSIFSRTESSTTESIFSKFFLVQRCRPMFSQAVWSPVTGVCRIVFLCRLIRVHILVKINDSGIQFMYRSVPLCTFQFQLVF